MTFFQLYATIYAVQGEPAPPKGNARGSLLVKPVARVGKNGVKDLLNEKPYAMDIPLHPLSAAEYRELNELPKELQV